ncbi:RNA pseudouridine synthase, partial [Candidatus Dojkabacteria bacterium]|nr:RNA pseudouridine synthase [Candidatus Dojkabacteria bacterium]
IVLGCRFDSEKILNAPIGRSPNNRLKMSTHAKSSKEAITHLKVLEYFQHFSHLELKLETGRTHQIRVHLSELLNAPIVNDELYGRSKEESKFFTSKMKSILSGYAYPLLHAKVLGFIHPVTKEKLRFEHPPSKIFLDTLNALRSENGKNTPSI